jgi:LacI family transcriptional regulator, repressor for deo operon, udp, cdd, tsx, nupC, and nupG
MVGIGEVAHAAGVSVATVSRALTGRGPVAEATQQHVVAVAADLGYVASSTAASLATGRASAVGVIVPKIDGWFYATVLASAQNELARAGLDLTLYRLGDGADARTRVFEQLALRGRTDALLAVSLEVTREEAHRLRASGKPIVSLGGPIHGIPSVSVDEIEMATVMTDHLASLGHRRIALISGAPGRSDLLLPIKRQVGYELALQRRAIRHDAALVETAGFSIESGFQAALHLLHDAARRPTAILAISDEMAMGAMLAARSLGLEVPRDVSIAGIDDHEHAAFFGLTTVAQYPAAQGAEAVRLLLQSIGDSDDDGGGGGGGDEAHDEPQPFDLIVRTSTAPPPAG